MIRSSLDVPKKTPSLGNGRKHGSRLDLVGNELTAEKGYSSDARCHHALPTLSWIIEVFEDYVFIKNHRVGAKSLTELQIRYVLTSNIFYHADFKSLDIRGESYVT